MDSNPTGGHMRDNAKARLAFKPGTNAPRRPRPVISMRYAREKWRATPRQRHSHWCICGQACRGTCDVSMARIRDAAWPYLSGGFRIPLSKLLLHFRAQNAAPTPSSTDLALTQRNRTAFDLDMSAGGLELDSRIEPIQATLPTRLLKGPDCNLILLATCCCNICRELRRTCSDKAEQHPAWELAIAPTWNHPISWEANS